LHEPLKRLAIGTKFFCKSKVDLALLLALRTIDSGNLESYIAGAHTCRQYPDRTLYASTSLDIVTATDWAAYEMIFGMDLKNTGSPFVECSVIDIANYALCVIQ
jgi:hypothetical protein